MINVPNKVDLLECLKFRDCQELSKIIMENPGLPLLILVDRFSDDIFGFSPVSLCRTVVEELTLYDGEWLNRKEYRENLIIDMKMDNDYSDLPDSDFKSSLEAKIKITPFVKVIAVYAED